MKTPFLIVFVLAGYCVAAMAQPCVERAKEVKPVLSDNARSEYIKKLDEAKAVYASKSPDADAIIWLGRRTAYISKE